MGLALTITSAKGGVGKTTLATNLGIALANLGKKVILLDGSLSTPDISLNLGIPFDAKTLHDITRRKTKLKDAIFVHDSGLHIIPGNIHIDNFPDVKKMKKIINEVKKQYDFVLLDSAQGLGKEAIDAMKITKNLLVVTNPEIASIVDAAKAIKIAKVHNVNIEAVILNRIGRFKGELQQEEILSILGEVNVIGNIPEDKRVPIATSKSLSFVNFYPRSKATKEIRRIALRLLGEEEKEHFFSRIFNW